LETTHATKIKKAEVFFGLFCWNYNFYRNPVNVSFEPI